MRVIYGLKLADEGSFFLIFQILSIIHVKTGLKVRIRRWRD